MTNVDEVSRLLALARGVQPPAGGAKAGLSRLLTSLTVDTAPMPVAVGALQLGSVAVAKWVGVGFLVGLTGAGVGASGLGSETDAATVPVASVSAGAIPLRAPARGERALSAPQPIEQPSNEATPAARPSIVRAPSAAAPQVSAAPRFDEELRLIAAAKRELDAGRPHLARAWLDEHQQRYRAGVFALEREGLRTLASCLEAPRPELVRNFARRYPESPMLPQLRRRCGAENSPSAPGQGEFSETGK